MRTYNILLLLLYSHFMKKNLASLTVFITILYTNSALAYFCI